MASKKECDGSSTCESTTPENRKLLFGDVDSSSAEDVCEWILDHNFSEDAPDILNLIINSPGGSLCDAFAIVDIMRTSRIPIKTIGIGQIASAGLIIFLAGAPGQRILTKNTSIMSHQYSWGSIGKHHELISVQKEYSLTFDRMLSHYKTNTNLSESEIEKYLLPSQDVYLSASEALAYGICDSILPS